jgi:hypothetical protein
MKKNKKILFVSILAAFILVTIAFASTVTSNTQKPPKKESPLFGIRTRRVIKDKIGDMLRRFVGERVFFLPFQLLRNNDDFFIKETVYWPKVCISNWDTTPCCFLN